MLNKVYIVDDDAISLFLTKEIVALHNNNCSSTCYMDAAQALNQLIQDGLANNMPDLILLDLNMPLMNGFEFVDKLEYVCKGLEVGFSVVILTSSVDDKDKKRSIQSNIIFDFIEKPLTEGKLSQIVTALSKRKKPSL